MFKRVVKNWFDIPASSYNYFIKALLMGIRKYSFAFCVKKVLIGDRKIIFDCKKRRCVVE